jgi:hypothetical protein
MLRSVSAEKRRWTRDLQSTGRQHRSWRRSRTSVQEQNVKRATRGLGDFSHSLLDLLRMPDVRDDDVDVGSLRCELLQGTSSLEAADQGEDLVGRI